MTFLKTKLKFINNYRLFRKHARWYHWLTIVPSISTLIIYYSIRGLLRRLAGGSSGWNGALTRSRAIKTQKTKSTGH